MGFVLRFGMGLTQGKLLMLNLFTPVLSVHMLFVLFALLAGAMVCWQTCCKSPVEPTKNPTLCDTFSKAFAVWPLPGIWLLGIFSFLFGFQTAYVNGYVNGTLVKNNSA